MTAKKLQFTATIQASAAKVWETLWNDTTYRQWVAPFHQGSYAKSTWKQGERVLFLSGGDGMYSEITRLVENKEMFFTHIGMVKNFEEQPLDEETKQWSGCTEKYTLTEANGTTNLLVEIDVVEAHLDYFKGVFPVALDIAKQLAEGTLKPTITIVANINAPVEKVWNLWTSPEHITKWNSASEDWHTPHATNDLRVGGKFTSRMEAKDGSFGFDFGGEYDDVKENELIAYTLGDNRKVKVAFSEQEGVTNVVETFEPETMNTHELQRNGWQAILDNFKKYAEAN